MADRAAEFTRIYEGLTSLKSDGWTGRAADHFRSKFEVQTKGWSDAQSAFSQASAAYLTYADVLENAQNQLPGIRSRWEQGRAAVQAAQANQDSVREQAAAGVFSPVFDASCDEGPGQSAMSRAQTDFNTLVTNVNDAGATLISALDTGIAMLPERTWLDSAGRTVSSVVIGLVEAVTDLAKLGFKLNGMAYLFDFGRMLVGDMTFDEFMAKQFIVPGETVIGLAKALWQDPGAFFEGLGKAALDWDTWADDPARAIGHLIPDVIIAVATVGVGTGAAAGEKTLSGAARAARIGKEIFKAVTPIGNIADAAPLAKNLLTKLGKRGINTAGSVTDLSRAANSIAHSTDFAGDMSHTGRGIHGLNGVGGHGGGAGHLPSSGTHDLGGGSSHISNGITGTHSAGNHGGGAGHLPSSGTHDLGGGSSHISNGITGTHSAGMTGSGRGGGTTGGGGIASGANHAAHGAGSTSHGVSSAADAAGNASHAAHSGGNAADAAGNASHATHAGGNAADATKAGHGSGDANGSGKVDADAKQGHDSVEHADADPKAKEHSANGKADDAADSAHHGDKTEADKPTSDKSHKEDDAAHHDGDTKPTKDEADTHKSDDDNSGTESNNNTATDKNREESQEIKSEEGTDETKRNPHSGDPDHNWGTYVDEDGIPHIDPSDPRPYLNPTSRPSYRKGVVDTVREEFTDADGVLRDWRGEPIDWQPGQPRKDIWDMGHRPGHQYRDVWRRYVNGEMTKKQFLDWYNEPKHYRVEFSSKNRGHKDENQGS